MSLRATQRAGPRRPRAMSGDGPSPGARRRRVGRRAALVMMLLLSLTGSRASGVRAPQAPLVFAVVVGNNDGLGMLPQLRYADDDALRFYRLAVRLAGEPNVALLTELDVDTWRRIQLVGHRPPPFLPPSKRKLEEVIGLFPQA